MRRSASLSYAQQVASSSALAERQRMVTIELEGRLAACSAQAEQSRLLAHRLQAAWLGLANLS